MQYFQNFRLDATTNTRIKSHNVKSRSEEENHIGGPRTVGKNAIEIGLGLGLGLGRLAAGLVKIYTS